MYLINHTFFFFKSVPSQLPLSDVLAYHISLHTCQNEVKILLQQRSKRTYSWTVLVFKLPIISTRNILILQSALTATHLFHSVFYL